MVEKGADTQRAVILTAIPVEYQAVRAHLTNIREELHSQGTIYEHGTFFAPDQLWEVIISEIGAGNPTAALEAERAINHFKPSVILFVGVAGGCKDVKLGDVVAATKVYGYESGKVESVFLPRPSIGNSTYRMEQRARAEARKHDWLQRLKGPLPSPAPIVYVAPIAAGEKVIASTRSPIAKFLQAQYGDALAVEMEGYGFLQATRANPHVEALVIRGISDLVDGKQEADAMNFQEFAAQHASAFAFEILAKFDSVDSTYLKLSPFPAKFTHKPSTTKRTNTAQTAPLLFSRRTMFINFFRTRIVAILGLALLLAGSSGVFYAMHFLVNPVLPKNNVASKSFYTEQYPSTPMKTIEAVCNAFKNRNFQTVYNLSSSQSDLRHRSEQDYAAVQMQIIAQRGDLVSCIITNVITDESGSIVSALITSTWSKSDNYMQIWIVVKENGRWKMLSYPSW
jgi:nucleoside phosphorylase